MSRSSAARHGDDAAPVPWASAMRASRTCWPRGTGCVAQVRAPRRAQRVARQQPPRHLAERRSSDREGDHLAARAARDAERAGHRRPTRRASSATCSWRLVAGDDRLDRRRGRRAARSRRRSAGPSEGKNASRTSGSSTRWIMSASDAQRAGPAAAVDLAADLAPRVARGGRGGGPGRSRAAARRRPRGPCRGRRGPRARARRRAAPRRRAKAVLRRLAGQQRAQQRERHAAQHGGGVERRRVGGSRPSR